ncbi:putative calcium-activated chloride channel regulator 1-like [Apostichopus japonicus]|uniref:Putative calcium-activated chloride channel regulator 1-like n=1 Tax=Stichopus japonicus TaxID=307972 RepID=A0A2G8KBW9_STIJA|nr:putative calcium-activated chloride channel regulator 1-like [Apostichopus japonicus]
MSGYTNFPTVRKFCDDLETTDPSLEHNPEAPNKHNRLCNQRSCWSIMREHPDFKDANLPSLVTLDVTPSVVLARSKPKRVVLVLDTSGSMNSLNRISKLASVSRNFITNVVVDGSHIGIVQFSNRGIRLSGLTVVDSDDTRQKLADLIPTDASGSTCIGCGLEIALEILTENGMDAAGSLVVLVTDGKDGETAKTNDFKNRYIEEGVSIDGVAFSNTAEENIVSLQIETGGKLFLQTDAPSSTGLYEAFQSTMESGIAENNRRIELHASSSTFEPNQVFSSGVYIDPTVGNNTLFDFSYFGGALDVQPLQIVITNPMDEVFDVSHEGYGEDLTFQIVTVRIPGTAVPGFWSYKVTNNHSSAIGVLITISTLASQDGVDPIIVSSELSGSITDFVDREPLIAFGEVRQGTYPIINVTVIATIERPPDQDGNPQDPVQIQLLDNGAGADVTKNDGIYSRYFTNFTGVGFYGIKLAFFNEIGSAIILRPAELPFSRVPAYVDPQELLKGNIPIIDGTILPLPGIPVPEPDSAPAPSFSRGISGGSSRVPEIPENWSPGDDLFPPNAILDLIVTSSSYETETATLQFTAPGDDLDSGYASFYVIRVAESSNHFKNNGTSILPLNTTDIIQGNILSPKLSGEREVFVVRISIPANGTMFSYHFAIHAVDNFGNQGDISNIASVTIDVPIPLTSTAPVTTELPSTTTAATVAATTAEPTEIPSTLQETTAGDEPAVTIGLVGIITGITFILVIVVCGFFCLIYVVAKRRAKAIGHGQGDDHERGYADPHTVKNKVFAIKN